MRGTEIMEAKSPHARPVPRILLYIPYTKFASKLAETLAEHAFAVATSADRSQLAAALGSDRYDAIVTGTAHVGEVRAISINPIINYEVFVHKHPMDPEMPEGNRSYFDVDDFISRIRFHVR